MSGIAFLYPGQGSQKVGMGRDFYEQYACARRIYDGASEKLNLDMQALCFQENTLLDQTEYTQVALVTTCLAMTAVIQERMEALGQETGVDIIPSVTAGLSLGEYCAIAVAGGMNVMDAISTVRQRGILMEHTVPKGTGTMAAVLGLLGTEIEEIIQEIDGVSIANYNCPGQIVITGTVDGVSQASEALKSQGAKRVIPLNVSGPFHSQMLRPAGESLGKVLADVKLQELRIPYVSNVHGQYVRKIDEVKELLEQQVYSSVRWEQSIRNMIEEDIDTFVEIGPGRTLTGFLKKIDKTVQMYHVESLGDLEELLEKIR